jgi:flagellar protein FlbD
MIRLTRLNHEPVYLNSDLIEHIEETPDTVILLTTGEILRVRESADQVVDRIVDFRRRILAPVGLGERRDTLAGPPAAGYEEEAAGSIRASEDTNG